MPQMPWRGKKNALIMAPSSSSSFSSSRSNSNPNLRFLFPLCILALCLVYYLFSFSSATINPVTTSHSLSIPLSTTTDKQTSFLLSLEDFLTRSPQQHHSSPTDDSHPRDDPFLHPLYPLDFPIRVYVYDMPSKFTYDLLRLFRDTYRDTSNLTSNGSPVHRLIEQHSIDYWLWADLLAPPSQRLLNHLVVRVSNPEDAHLFYIPFFTTISFFLLEKQRCKALYREALQWVTDQPYWKLSDGRDHILAVHHPWSFKTVRKFMKHAIWLLPDMDSTGNWYKPGQVYLEKDVIMPYVPNVDLCDARCLFETLPKRTNLLFFRGRLKRNAGGKIRAKLTAELSGAPGVIIEEGTAGEAGKIAAQNGMRSSVFCLCPAGDTPSSARLFDAIVSGCIPVIVSDELELPFEGVLDYRKMALFVSSSDAIQPGWLLNYLKSVDPAQIRELQVNLGKYSKHYVYSKPAQPFGPEDLTWRMIAGKIVNIKLHTLRSQRVVKESRSICTCECKLSNVTMLETSKMIANSS